MSSEPFHSLPWVVRVHEVLEEGSGFWRSCSGCHELNDGAPTGDYSSAFRAHVGIGCRECGGLGVVWDDTDYADMADFLIQGIERDNLNSEVLKALIALYSFVSSNHVSVPDEQYHNVTAAASIIAKVEGRS